MNDELTCEKCGSKVLRLKGRLVTEYHDASIGLEGRIEGGCLREVRLTGIEGSYYLDEESTYVECVKCGHKKALFECDFSDETFEKIVKACLCVLEI